jgi:hypothetical protein
MSEFNLYRGSSIAKLPFTLEEFAFNLYRGSSIARLEVWICSIVKRFIFKK